jgi:hypothetical protein
MTYDTSLNLSIGDRVYFYFMHVFCVPRRIDIDHAEASTGKFEMRCRPARVVALNPPADPTGIPELDRFTTNNLPMGQIHLDVEFRSEDRVPLPGGCGGRPARAQRHVGAHLGRDRLGEVGDGWPDPNRWARTAKVVDNG